ncbi:antA/AntB antirepressor family protein [Vitreoscilla stercoraria]|uniref:AntA/AntB antirepressor family protein n=1 Tax=Vitreoscilla stercoraria TaxID=61 RepID=A0ABY4EJ66_VITST|nr:antA/AntB antirepressor family protein [Vitreoscilla stercoraria]UOO93417.1 antA/AntB antirepressor family protein [Vitreoscilla stercoraria]
MTAISLPQMNQPLNKLATTSENRFLVPVFQGTLNGIDESLVDARTLHKILQVGKVFAAWIKARISEYGFVENEDFKTIFQTRKIGHGRGKIDYHLSLDMAKELAMIEKSDIGRMVRRYFIQCERIANKMTGRSTTTDERTGLRDAVNAVVSKKGMLYPDAYKLVHQCFNVEHIDELTLEQVGEATEYLHRLLLTTEKSSGYVLEEYQVKNLVNAAQSMDWIFCWFNHYKMALSVINPKMVSSVSEHFKVVWIHTQNFGRKHDMVALNHTTMRDYPWAADYESQKDWRKVVGIYK